VKPVIAGLFCALFIFSTSFADPELSKPSEIDIGSSIRRVNIASPMGRVSLKWARSAETLFGRTPERALADAMATVHKALLRFSSSQPFADPNFEWDVVVMDEKLPTTQIPRQLVQDCHPAWMVPPSNIYVVAQRVAAGCSGGSSLIQHDADAALARALIHEIGHAVEFALIQNRAPMVRARAEGFATWFEHFASDYSSLIAKGSIERGHRIAAKALLRAGGFPQVFKGTYDDYVVASLPFYAIEERKGVHGIEAVYSEIVSGKDFAEATRSVLGWDDKKMSADIQRWIEK
jgi:hypothetical protein